MATLESSVEVGPMGQMILSNFLVKGWLVDPCKHGLLAGYGEVLVLFLYYAEVVYHCWVVCSG